MQPNHPLHIHAPLPPLSRKPRSLPFTQSPACSPQRIFFTQAWWARIGCGSLTCAVSQLFFRLPYRLWFVHPRALLCVLWVSLSLSCTSYRLPPSLSLFLFLSLTLSLSLSDCCHYNLTVPRRGQHIRVNPFCLAALMFVATLRRSINARAHTQNALISRRLKCVFWAMIYSSLHWAPASLTWDRAAQL